ncbi:polyglutamine-binding protein 1-like [Ctenocephalides felis]|uniref:polyglutamine-binding protein 1-like n=1 Tax=Ctenocephalides felis TaxID=7515 RepID=UPI000E6E2D87|nr:polyglutamine-binding protein 1-like [Ctenocephalides felis]
MPLPPALAARLAKRGIAVPQNEQPVEPTEEIIAEDYDETAPTNPQKEIPVKSYIPAEKDYEFDLDINFKIKGYENCPNKYNIYHDCSHYCVKKWKNGHTEPDVKYLEKKMRMLMKYPLPDNWKEVYDKGVGRHYYWDTSNDLVSWLPPAHPKAIITESASALREERLMKEGDESDDSGAGSSEEESTVSKYDSKREEKSGREFKRPHPPQQESKSSKRARQQERVKSTPLDPMDPSSYSDVPRGNWASGLQNQTEAKTGVDTTASGSLYQMRPYPSPGAILSANNKNKPPAEDSGKKSIMYPQLPDEDDD